MSEIQPPPLSKEKKPGNRLRRRARIAGLAFLWLLALAGATLLILWGGGLLQVFSIPNRGMSPALDPGDQIVMEGLTYLFTRPKRGDIVIFKTGELAGMNSKERWAKRLVGLPGERLRLAKGVISVDGQPTHFYNRAGEIHYEDLPFRTKYLADGSDTFTVPAGHYFVIGDNSGNSVDSRLWGSLPASAVVGRVACCYLPGSRMGKVE